MRYQDTAVFYKAGLTGYANSKVVDELASVDSIFLQNTGFLHSNNQDAIDSDAVIYPNPSDEFIQENANRLEGMTVKVVMFGSEADESWYKIVNVSVNRDHLLTNIIDNIECLVKKTRPLRIGGTS